jgi:hypothetical protein
MAPGNNSGREIRDRENEEHAESTPDSNKHEIDKLKIWVHGDGDQKRIENSLHGRLSRAEAAIANFKKIAGFLIAAPWIFKFVVGAIASWWSASK